MATAGDAINGAMRLLNILDQDTDADADQLATGLTALNEMLDSWSIERLSVFSTQDQDFTWPASTLSRTLGPSGDFVGNRPVQVDDSSYFVQPGTGVSYSFSIINQEQYNGIALKTATSTYPSVMWVNYDMPNITMTVYPKPTIDLTFHIVSVTELTQPATADTELILPPGYLRAFRFNLACEIASEYGLTPPARVSRLADVSKRNIKRINSPGDLLGMPATILRNWQRYNIFAGNF